MLSIQANGFKLLCMIDKGHCINFSHQHKYYRHCVNKMAVSENICTSQSQVLHARYQCAFFHNIHFLQKNDILNITMFCYICIIVTTRYQCVAGLDGPSEGLRTLHLSAM